MVSLAVLQIGKLVPPVAAQITPDPISADEKRTILSIRGNQHQV